MTDKKWVFTREDGAQEEVTLQDWIWGVLYKDGTELHQFDDNGVFHQIKEIDQSKAALWVLYQPKGKGDGRIEFVVPEGKEVALIHKYKVYGLNVGTPAFRKETVHVFGYKIKGGLPHYNFVMPSGRIIQSYGEQNPKLSEMNL